MKKIFFAIAAIAMALTSCTIHMKDNKEGAAGEKVTKLLDLKDFSAIKVSGAADIEFTEDSVYKVEFVGKEKVFEIVDIKVYNGTLYVSWKDKKPMFFGNDGYTLRVSAPKLNALEVSGACEFEAGSLTADDFSLYISGAGDVKIGKLKAGNVSINVEGAGDIDAGLDNCGDVKVNIQGAGDVKLKGKARSLKKDVAGVADLNTRNLELATPQQ